MKTRAHIHDNDAVHRLSSALACFLRQPIEENRRIVFACVGSDRSTGDALGPLVGTKLSESFVPNNVVGSLEQPLHALNLKDRLSNLTGDPFIVAVDAACGNPDARDTVAVQRCALKPGLSLGKTIPAIGDITVVGVLQQTSSCREEQARALQSTRLHTVMQMADLISASVLAAYSEVTSIT